MANRKEIINNLKEDLKKINVINGYSTELNDIRIGILDPNKFDLKPAIGLMSYEDNVTQQLFGNEVQRNLKFVIYGYMDIDEDFSQYEELFNFTTDVEKFLYSDDNTFKEDTLITMTKMSYGGTSSSVGYFMIFFDVNYNQTDL